MEIACLDYSMAKNNSQEKAFDFHAGLFDYLSIKVKRHQRLAIILKLS